MIRSRQVIPFLLGSNIGTLSDTGATALVLGTGRALSVVGWLAGCVALFAIIALIGFRFYEPLVGGACRYVGRSRRGALVFAGVLVGIPVLLVSL